MIRLTDEEIENITDNIACSFIGAVAESGLEPGIIIKRAIANNQLKKVVEWGDSGCPHGGCLPGGHYEFSRNQCSKRWQALLEEVK